MKDQSAPPSADISLRPFTISDLDAAMTWLTDDRVGRNMRWDTCKTRDEALSFLTRVILPHPWCRAICVGGGDPVGFIYSQRLSGVDSCRAELGCSLAWEHWGRGIAAAATRMAAAEVFAMWPEVERLEARAEVRNEASQRALEKAGFHREALLRRFRIVKGELLDMVQYSLLRPKPKM